MSPDPAASAAAPGGSALPPERARLRVVIADDVATIRRLVRFALDAAGRFEVVGEAADGEEAVAVVARTRPDVVLLDLSMPRLGGLEALPRLRAAAPESKVVIYSGFTSDRMASIAGKLGAVRYVEKGGKPADIVACLLDVAREAAEAAPRTEEAGP